MTEKQWKPVFNADRVDEATQAIADLTPREMAGRLLLHKRHRMGDSIDAGKVQDYLEELYASQAAMFASHKNLQDALKSVLTSSTLGYAKDIACAALTAAEEVLK